MRTKIIATIGPASMKKEIMAKMVDSGVRIFRLNFSHADARYFQPVIAIVRELEQEKKIPLTAMADLCGPKIRIGEIKDSPVQIIKNQKICLGPPEKRGAGPEDMIFVTLDSPKILKGLKQGSAVYLADGMLHLTISQILEEDTLYELTAQNNGILTSKKGIAFPDTLHSLSALTPKDRKDLKEALAIGIDAVALSFVQNSKDILDAKEIIKSQGQWIPVVAKLERKKVLMDVDSIVEAADCIMVARGDLGVECSLSSLPVIQKHITRICRHKQKPVIIATQMLLSMVKNPGPTRAEAADVANAVLDGADCVMLSEETAIGDYPVEVCQFIQHTAQSAERYYLERLEGPYRPSKEKNIVKYLAYSACLTAEHEGSKALVCHSTSGYTAHQISSRRPAQPIYALTPNEAVLRWLNFFWAVKPRPANQKITDHMERAFDFIDTSDNFTTGDSVVITSGQPKPPGQTAIKTNTVRLYYK